METLEREAAAPAGTSLEILAPYFPYQVQVQVLPDGWDPCTVVGLDGFECKILTRWFDELYNPDSFTGRTSIQEVLYSECLPVLRPFSQVCEPLADGTVPAVEVAKLLGRPPLLGEYELRYCPNGGLLGAHDCIDVYVGGTNRGSLCDDWETVGNWSILKVAEYLRKHHFAVGLKPHQYIEKSAAATIQEGKSDE